MSRSKKKKSANKGGAGQVVGSHASAGAITGGNAAVSESSSSLNLAKKICLGICVPVLIFVVLELVLRIAGYGYSTDFFVPAGDGRNVTVNHRYGWQFFPRETATVPFPCLMPAGKPEKAIRIFALGESAALGTPDPAFGFSRILDVMLKKLYPDRRFEVINAAMWGINSHVVLPIARECAEYEPDLFIIYMGNNEVVGLHAPEPDKRTCISFLRLLRGIQWLKTTRTGQLADSAYRSGCKKKEKPQDMDFFRDHRLASDDPRRQAVRNNFQANLNDILETTRRSGAKTILSTVAVNLKDCPPLGSLHGSGLSGADEARWRKLYAEGITAESGGQYEQAISLYAEAAKLDDHYADLNYRLACCYYSIARYDRALEYYRFARDWDALQFRSDGRVNEIVRRSAAGAGSNDVRFVDTERFFAESGLSDHGIAGRKIFYEHAHLCFDGDYLLAGTLLPEIVNALNLQLPSNAAIPGRQECAEMLAFTSWNELDTAASMVRLTGQPPFLDQVGHRERQAEAERMIAVRLRGFNEEELQRVIGAYRKTILQRPDDWPLYYNLGCLFMNMKNHAAAVHAFEQAVQIIPGAIPPRMSLAGALMSAGRYDEAIQQFRKVLKIEPGYMPAVQAVARIKALRK